MGELNRRKFLKTSGVVGATVSTIHANILFQSFSEFLEYYLNDSFCLLVFIRNYNSLVIPVKIFDKMFQKNKRGD